MRSFLGSLAVLTAATSASATLTAYDIAAQLEQLAFQTYAAKPIVQAFTQSNVRPTLIGQGPVVITNTLLDEMVTTIVANVAAMEFTAAYTDETSELAIAQSFSDFVQGSLELCDAYTAAAATVESTDAYTSAKISDAITRLGTATDVYIFNVIAIVPTDPDAPTQKNRLDNHFVQAATAWNLISLPLGEIPDAPQFPLGNSTHNSTSPYQRSSAPTFSITAAPTAAPTTFSTAYPSSPSAPTRSFNPHGRTSS